MQAKDLIEIGFGDVQRCVTVGESKEVCILAQAIDHDQNKMFSGRWKEALNEIKTDRLPNS